MNDELFAELVESVRRAGMPVREGGAILRGKRDPSRKFVIEAPDVKLIREQYDLSQREFSALLCIRDKTMAGARQ